MNKPFPIRIDNMGPAHEHDCDQCTYVCTVHEVLSIPQIFDCYICNRGFDKSFTVITRFSSEPSDYRSGATFAAIIGERQTLRLCAEMALYMGIITEDEYHEQIGPYRRLNK